MSTATFQILCGNRSLLGDVQHTLAESTFSRTALISFKIPLHPRWQAWGSDVHESRSVKQPSVSRTSWRPGRGGGHSGCCCRSPCAVWWSWPRGCRAERSRASVVRTARGPGSQACRPLWRKDWFPGARQKRRPGRWTGRCRRCKTPGDKSPGPLILKINIVTAGIAMDHWVIGKKNKEVSW